MQTSDNRKKISFRWNSQIVTVGSLVEQQSSMSTDNKKLVPYEDNVSDDSEHLSEEPEEITENMHVVRPDTNADVKYCADSYENMCPLTARFARNVHTDDIVSATHTEKLCRPNQPTEMSENKYVPDCKGRLLPSDDSDCGTNILSEFSSNLLSVPELESADKEAASLFTGITESGLNGDMGYKNVHTKPAAEHDSGICQVQSVKNSHPFDNSYNVVSHSPATRKRHARCNSRQHRTKHRCHHINSSSALTVYGSDDEVEYVWVEKTAETIAQQLTGR